MVYSKHLKSTPKKYEIIVIKWQQIHLVASILACFCTLEPVQGRLGDHPGMGTQKTTKKQLFETHILQHICDRCWCFWGHVFYMFFKLSTSILFAPAGAPRSQLSRSLASSGHQINESVEKVKPLKNHCFCCGLNTYCHCILPSFPFVLSFECAFVYSRLAACIVSTILSNLQLLCLLCLHFSTHFPHFQASISRPRKRQKNKIRSGISGRASATHLR